MYKTELIYSHTSFNKHEVTTAPATAVIAQDESTNIVDFIFYSFVSAMILAYFWLWCIDRGY